MMAKAIIAVNVIDARSIINIADSLRKQLILAFINFPAELVESIS